jgi:hypothetical protein
MVALVTTVVVPVLLNVTVLEHVYDVGLVLALAVAVGVVAEKLAVTEMPAVALCPKKYAAGAAAAAAAACCWLRMP